MAQGVGGLSQSWVPPWPGCAHNPWQGLGGSPLGLRLPLGGRAGAVRTAKALGLRGGGGGASWPLRHCPLYRLHKCRLCYKQLKSISGLVKSKSGLSGRHGSTFRELHLLMASLD